MHAGLGMLYHHRYATKFKEPAFFITKNKLHRWITIANGYIRTLIFNSKIFIDTQKNKLQKLVSYIYVYEPSFLMIHLNPKVPEGLFLSIFHRDLLSCFVEIDPNITDVVMKYFLAHASQCLSWKNVALSVHA